MTNKVLFDRVLGAIVGVAVGDALGGPLEFMDAEQIAKKHGQVRDMIGGGWLDLAPGEVTDDTQMTMCVARGIAKDPKNPYPWIGQNFVQWMRSGPKDVGGTCAMAIKKAVSIKAFTLNVWLIAARDTDKDLNGQTDGNGALMRTIYPAVFYHDRERRQHVVSYIAMMTHFGSASREICVEYAYLVHEALFGANIHELVREEVQYRPNTPPTGYVAYSWYNAIEAIMGTDNFEEAVVRAVNRGGDADTIGAITGGLAGAMYGYSSIPTRWVDALDKALLAEMEDLARLACDNISKELE